MIQECLKSNWLKSLQMNYSKLLWYFFFKNKSCLNEMVRSWKIPFDVPQKFTLFMHFSTVKRCGNTFKTFLHFKFLVIKFMFKLVCAFLGSIILLNNCTAQWWHVSHVLKNTFEESKESSFICAFKTRISKQALNNLSKSTRKSFWLAVSA